MRIIGYFARLSFAVLHHNVGAFTSVSSLGDVILTGTPGGIGKKRTPPLFMQPGDRVEVEIEHIGCLINTVCSDELSFTGRLHPKIW
ncbi:fumarylacetoacetate hydrolase family protein [Citrobacter rodentium NBRC 105723 = DSM 16636]|uniref:Fumarylacetoacetase-like C-terminal domain-containing protein n=2 Tax=Citrobacter rodentium TaxID=67825 RepID=D2TK05_CITRI|nr:hypothetical protein E2R62_24040 [Citrobacter rodentium]UHO33609.1 fumarylacetoacetate hydrolase family protein [Citrobacter rodentium NBRC 105723 = DSM 16636]CBG87135.1 hypothetical protein ROD_03531 [Citrobacter rodentium ICC168]